MVDLRTGAVRAFEALARWDVDGERLTPDDVLPHLDGHDVDALFREVLGRVMRHLSDWDRQGIEVGVSVNVDPATLRHPRCSSWVEMALHEHSVPAARLSIEVLETGPVDSEAQAAHLARLRQLGVHVGMDDFGTGHSTIARLTDLPFDVVKIDRSLVGLLVSDPRSAASKIDALVSTATEQGCGIVAEGVESRALAEAVRLLGAHLAQGYYYACPMPPVAVAGWVRARPASSADEAVTTFLGAFAFHWRHASAGRVHPGEVDECAVSAVLRAAQVGTDASVTGWHAAQHGDRADPAAARALEEWLAARVAND